MLDNLFDQHELMGMPREDLLSLLGRPESEKGTLAKPHQGQSRTLRYSLGSRLLYDDDSAPLYIVFDESDYVAGIWCFMRGEGLAPDK